MVRGIEWPFWHRVAETAMVAAAEPSREFSDSLRGLIGLVSSTFKSCEDIEASFLAIDGRLDRALSRLNILPEPIPAKPPPLEDGVGWPEAGSGLPVGMSLHMLCHIAGDISSCHLCGYLRVAICLSFGRT